MTTFVNNRPLSKWASKFIEKMYPNGMMCAIEKLEADLRNATNPLGCEKSLSEMRREILEAASDDVTVIVRHDWEDPNNDRYVSLEEEDKRRFERFKKLN